MASLSISEMGLVLTVIRIRGVLQNRKKLVVIALLRENGLMLASSCCLLTARGQSEGWSPGLTEEMLLLWGRGWQ